MPLLSLRATAKLLGISHQRLGQLRDAGKATPEPDGRFDLEKVRAELKRTIDPMSDSKILGTAPPKPEGRVNGKAKPEAPPKYTESRIGMTQVDARTKLTLVRAEREAFNLRKDRDEVLPVSDVRDAWASVISSARSILLSVGAELAEKLAAETDVIRCQELIDGPIRRALDQLSRPPI
ncbi:MAG TPA: hypothetical protein VMY69_00045 [Phycisphaerae bacterium]|nr:hypothetical protein [Phycisphaerae bacterium]